ncbi:MAG: amidohydrolase family protein [Candidatus Heimdallarchaeota archaeon]|nr:MAG: amidohydrolase family protein [Candidatus Heimdallarchaeota archaeon]
MERLLLKNGLIVTMNANNKVISQGNVLVEDGKIVKVGKDITEKVDIVIDCSDQVVFPGFICAHTHLYSALLRGAPLLIDPPTDFTQNLQRIWWTMDEALTLEDAYTSALYAVYELALNGVTAYLDTYSGPNSIEGSLDRISKATQDVGIRGAICFESTERRSHEEGIRGLEENQRFISHNNPEKTLVHGIYCLHASFTVSDELIHKTVEYAAKTDSFKTIHTSEGLADLHHNLEKYGKRTVERLYDEGFLGPKTALAHAVHINEHEIDLIAETRTNVAHNPKSNELNAVGVAQLPEMLQKGINIGVGNDGFIYDAIENMRTAYLMHKLNHRNPSQLPTPLQVVQMITINAAQAIGLKEQIGSIEIGKAADFTILDTSVLPTPIHENNVFGHLVYGSFSRRDVKRVIVNGKTIVKNGIHASLDATMVSQQSIYSAISLWERLDLTPRIARQI